MPCNWVKSFPFLLQFAITSSLTDGKRVEDKVDSTKIPIYPKYFVSDTTFSGKSLKQLAKNLPEESIEFLIEGPSDQPVKQHADSVVLDSKAALPECGYK